jgi:hypothetical protein
MNKGEIQGQTTKISPSRQGIYAGSVDLGFRPRFLD